MSVLPLVVALSLAGASDGSLKQGVRLYRAQRYSDALAALTTALTEKRDTPRQLARVRVYIGLIQLRFDAKDDARASFSEALKLHPRIRLPKGSPKSARTMFGRLKRRANKRRRSAAARAKVAPPSAPPEPSTAVEPPPPPTVAPEQPPASLPRIAGPPPKARPIVRAVIPEDESSLSTPGWICAGAGVASAAVGGVFMGLAFSNQAAARDEPVALEAERLHGSAITQRNVALAAGTVGVSLIAVGLVMVLSD